jgi:membrane protease YdiL (CAAX protease family)
VLLAIGLYKVLARTMATLVVANGTVYQWLKSAYEAGVVLTPGVLLFNEGIQASAAVLTGVCMAKIEGRSFSDYRVPWKEAFGKRFLQGIPLGLAMLVLLMSSMYVLKAVSFGIYGLSASQALKNSILYCVGFSLVGFFEEGSFRGYLQATLETDFDFWPTAVIVSVTFAATHVHNPGESFLGVSMAGCFGLVAAFSVLRTGSVWFAVGMHAAWDWGQSSLYGVPNSGIIAGGDVLLSRFHGPAWLTGGSVGPEGSVLLVPILLLWVLAIHLMFPVRPANA